MLDASRHVQTQWASRTAWDQQGRKGSTGSIGTQSDSFFPATVHIAQKKNNTRWEENRARHGVWLAMEAFSLRDKNQQGELLRGQGRAMRRPARGLAKARGLPMGG